MVTAPITPIHSGVLHRYVEDTRGGPSVGPAFGLTGIRNYLLTMLTQCVHEDADGESSFMTAFLKTDAQNPDPLKWLLLQLGQGIHPHTIHLALRTLVGTSDYLYLLKAECVYVY